MASNPLYLSNSSITFSNDHSSDDSDDSSTGSAESDRQIIVPATKDAPKNVLKAPGVTFDQAIRATFIPLRERSRTSTMSCAIDPTIPEPIRELRRWNQIQSILLHLPLEIKFEILKHLVPEDLLMLGCVCHGLREVIDDNETWRIVMGVSIGDIPLRQFFRKRVLYDYQLSTGSYALKGLKGHIFRVTRLVLGNECLATFSRRDRALFIWKARSGQSIMQLSHIETFDMAAGRMFTAVRKSIYHWSCQDKLHFEGKVLRCGRLTHLRYAPELNSLYVIARRSVRAIDLVKLAPSEPWPPAGTDDEVRHPLRCLTVRKDDPRFFGTASEQPAVRLWDIRSKSPILGGKWKRQLKQLEWSEHRLYTLDERNIMLMFDIRKGLHDFISLVPTARGISTFSLTPGGIVTGDKGGIVRFWDADFVLRSSSRSVHTRKVTAVQMDYDAGVLVSASSDHGVKLFTFQTGTESQRKGCALM